MYDDSSKLTGNLQNHDHVAYTKTLSKQDHRQLLAYGALVLATSVAFVGYVLWSITFNKLSLWIIVAVALILLLELIRVLQSITLLFFAHAARDPIPMIPKANQRVAVLTTIVPAKEPFTLVAQTLKAMKAIEARRGTTVDVWLLDEGNSPAIRARCELMGVNYFSRQGLEGWNAGSGRYKARTKHGNHNAWRRANEHRYDIVAQMDPDHVPRTDFLERTLGYFRDPTVGFVVAPQVYGNIKENWIARASAFQAYVFHGVIQRGGNGLGAPLLIGTNHLYRTQAFKQIGGYQDSIIEDHLTSMVLFSARNQDGKKWKGVYTPDIVAVGEGPVSFTDYFNQQKRWAYGIWEIMMKSSWRLLPKMSPKQSATFMMLQFFYPSVAVAWVLSSIVTLLLAFSPLDFHGVASVITVLWIYSIATTLGLFFWLRKFNLVEHERRTWGLGGMALLLMCIPIYVSAALQALRREPLTYAVTAKGSKSSPDTIQTFLPHIAWLQFNFACLVLLYILNGRTFTTTSFWIMEHAVICVAPIVIYVGYRVISALGMFRRLFGKRLELTHE